MMMDRVKLVQLEEALYRACKYFEGRADVDHNGNMFIANEEAQLWGKCEEALIIIQKEIIKDVNK